MKAQVTISKMLGMMVMVVFMAFATTNTQAQNNKRASTSSQDGIMVKGIVSNETEPLAGVNVILKGANVGAVTDENGAFTFPKALKPGDILVFSFLGYEDQEVKITEKTSFIKLMLTQDLIEIMGAVNTDKPYKSKRNQ